MRILIVDDSKLSRMVLKRQLNDFGLNEIVEAESGDKALELIDNCDAVFVDLLMPNMSGETLVEEIKKRNPALKVVVVTANIQEKVKERLLGMGIECFIPKPITKEKIKIVAEKLKNEKRGA